MSVLRVTLLVTFVALALGTLLALVFPPALMLKDWLALATLLTLGAAIFLPQETMAASGSATQPVLTPIPLPAARPAPARASKEIEFDLVDKEEHPVFELVPDEAPAPKPRALVVGANGHANGNGAGAATTWARPDEESAPRVVAASSKSSLFPTDHNGIPSATVTRGMCSRCGTKLTLSSRRPLRATCPVCGNSKLLK